MTSYNRARPSFLTLVLTQRGCVRRIVQSGVSLWRRLYSLMGALLDDDDDDDDDDDEPHNSVFDPERQYSIPREPFRRKRKIHRVAGWLLCNTNRN